ncbi:MAG: protein-L-isoaspartate O-methyltransferase [Alphaproteobacteria bacterium]|jgi:protein-L-isoaspartate(D-aspartate) O-methyltransferase|nr:protein-L-isoaspartate O-methyltransferase [Alphaproteobacteria bacterium]MDP7173553.1 protein-L-isoaspartate O-methyltransferase [Alphaproteobacteria bacterium]MDP7233982.1 protein-L-isoaspartate O-methyltransferase [Alphaproteobacteria bacterium]MDP7486798.1 protein-L-isoaspartate O-methyltransferase [Alphaproteobacteria bacterium]|tara:strand:- start:1445 stop:2116 length:672 start_codon:yes stop_codon:yes gene_type:complete
MPDFATMRAHMVEGQILPNKVTDPRIVEAMAIVPRECFVTGPLQAVPYVDEDLAIGNGRYLTEPAVLARMIQMLDPGHDNTALDIGCASGYSSAILGRLAGTVIALESDVELSTIGANVLPTLDIDNVLFIEGDLTQGYADQAPYDVILIGGGVEKVPEVILEQLAEGGRLATVISQPLTGGHGHLGQVTLYTRIGGVVSSRALFDAALPMLPGFRASHEFVL